MTQLSIKVGLEIKIWQADQLLLSIEASVGALRSLMVVVPHSVPYARLFEMHRRSMAPWAFQATRSATGRRLTFVALLQIEHEDLASTLWTPRALAVRSNRDDLLTVIATGKIATGLWTSHAAALEQFARDVATQTLRLEDAAH